MAIQHLTIKKNGETEHLQNISQLSLTVNNYLLLLKVDDEGKVTLKNTGGRLFKNDISPNSIVVTPIAPVLVTKFVEESAGLE